MFCSKKIIIILVFTLIVGLRATEYDFLKYLNTSTNPCDDFFEFSCGNFEQHHPLPDNTLILDNFQLVEKNLLEVVNEILTRPRTEDEPQSLKKVKLVYNACVGDGNINVIPELTVVDEYGGLPIINKTGQEPVQFSWNDIGTITARTGVPLVFNFIIQPHYFNASSFFLYFQKDSLSNPDLIRPELKEQNYDNWIEESLVEFSEKPKNNHKSKAATQQPFDIFLEKLIGRMAGTRNPLRSLQEINDDLEDMRAFMRNLYNGGIVEEDLGSLPDLPMMTTVGDLQKWTEQQFGDSIELNWIDYLNSVFGLSGVEITNDIEILYSDTNFNLFIYGILNLVRQTDPQVVKNFALLRVLLFLAPDSDSYIREAFEEYYRSKNYTLYPRWEYCTRKILDATGSPSFSFAATYDYERYHFNVKKIQEAKDLVTNIEKSFRNTVNSSDWIDDDDKPKALNKVDKILMLLGYPQFVNDKAKLDIFYSNIRACGWDGYGNAQRIRSFKQAYIFSQLDKSRDRAFWDKSTFTVNAYYNRANNRIVLPIAMLHDIFFSGESSIYDYGRLGCVIGHEITHGFDSEGRKYNENGELVGWWSTNTTSAFGNRTQCFVEQYNQYYIEPIGTYVDGSKTLNENLADNGGLRGSFHTYLKRRGSRKPNQISDYTDEQLFFIAYGTMWCSVQSPKYLTQLDEHYPPNKFRVNGAISNLAEFSTAFNCPVGSNMNPVNKCILW